MEKGWDGASMLEGWGRERRRVGARCHGQTCERDTERRTVRAPTMEVFRHSRIPAAVPSPWRHHHCEGDLGRFGWWAAPPPAATAERAKI